MSDNNLSHYPRTIAQIMAQQKKPKRHTSRQIAVKNRRVLPSMPVHVWYQPPLAIVSYSQGDQIHFHVGAPQTQIWPPPEPPIDAYRIRQDFLRVETSSQAAEFLRLTGFFLKPKQDGVGPCLDITWAEFQQWQELIRLILTDGFFELTERQTDGISRILPNIPPSMDHLLSRLDAEDLLWLAGQAQHIMIHPGGGNSGRGRDELIAMIMVDSTLEAILATIYLDGLNDIGHALCGLKDCPQYYEVTSKHVRQYCSQACAHKASVRRCRAAAARAKARSTKSAKDKRGTKQ